jgi:hypothetical protein
MRGEFAAPDTDSPPSRPSAWQLRFGKKCASRDAIKSKAEAGIRPNAVDEPRSPSISEQLLRALDRTQSDEEASSRECVDVLLGRRNAFAGEPELRLRSQANLDEHVYEEDAATEAKEIIRVRFQVETQAEALRQAPGHRKPTKRRSEAMIRSATAAGNSYSSRTTTRSSQPGPQRYDKTDASLRVVRKEQDNQKTEARPRQLPRNTSTDKKPRPRVLPPQQLPMERRQELLQQAREARRAKAAEEQAMLEPEPASSDNNENDVQEQRRIEEQIERLTLENQQAAALEERLQHRKVRLKLLSQVFEGWQQRVEYARQQESRVATEYNWRRMKLFMTSWKRYTQRLSQARVAEQSRLKLVQQRQMNERALRFHRLKRLPVWFYRWSSVAALRKERRAAEEATARRRAQTERLLERLTRQKGVAEEGGCTEREEDPPQEASRTPTQATRSFTPAVKLRQHRRMISEWQATEGHQTATPDSHGRAPPSGSLPLVPPAPHFPEAATAQATEKVGKAFKAMEQRAVERKLRREKLKRRYEELEQKKRQEQEQQRAAREALLLQQRTEEKARVRERKLAEALALKEKRDRRAHWIAQRQKASEHNRRRLLFYYALLPWRQHHLLHERVCRNAGRWHELRTVYSHWERWQEFVQIRRTLRRRRERVQLVEAGKRYDRCLQRRVFTGFMRHHRATEARALAVHRQTQWNTLQRSWTHWHRRLVSERTAQRKVVLKATAHMQQAKLRRIYAQWRQVVSEAKLQKELEREKQQLWRKVRGWLDEDA